MSDDEYLDPAPQQDDEYAEAPSTRVRVPARTGIYSQDRIEERRAANRESHERVRANETEEQRARRLASNLVSVQARRARIRTAHDDEARRLQLEATRRATAASSQSEREQSTRDLDEARLLFYQLTLPAAGAHSSHPRSLALIRGRGSRADYSTRN